MVLALHITSFHIYTPQQKLFFAVGFLMGMAPIPLDILGVESFTIGPANSIFTIFEFHSSGEGFCLSLFPMSMLAISVIAGLVYAIIKTGKPRNRAIKG